MDYNEVNAELIAKLEAIAPGRVYTGSDISDDYSHDEMPIYGKFTPEAAVEVMTTEEVSEIMKLANEYKVPVTPRGAGTGLTGAAVPVKGGILLVTTRMNKILEFDEINFTVRVQPGALLKDVADAASEKGFLYPPDPGEKFATIGGNVATNAGGMRAVKYGCTREYVKAATVVLPTGEIVQLGSSVTKTSSGYSLLNLIIGSEGTLGVITELLLKVIPQPKETLSLIIPYPDLESCIDTVPMFFKENLKPQALEFMEKDIVIASESYVGKQVFPRKVDGEDAEAYLLVTFDGDSMDELEIVMERASEVCLEAGALDVFVADTPALKRDAWTARGSFLEAIIAKTKYIDECDVVVPISRIADYVIYTDSIKDEIGLQVMGFGHAGDGNLHIYCGSNDCDEAEFIKRAEAFMIKAYDKAIEFGGQVSGEHGIGFAKIDYLVASVGEVQMRIMEGIKKTFDPNMILNPGKVCNIK